MTLHYSGATDSPLLYPALSSGHLRRPGYLGCVSSWNPLGQHPVNTNTEDYDHQNQSPWVSEVAAGRESKYCHWFTSVSSNRRAQPQEPQEALFSRKTSPLLFEALRIRAKRIPCSYSQMNVSFYQKRKDGDSLFLPFCLG